MEVDFKALVEFVTTGEELGQNGNEKNMVKVAKLKI